MKKIILFLLFLSSLQSINAQNSIDVNECYAIERQLYSNHYLIQYCDGTREIMSLQSKSDINDNNANSIRKNLQHNDSLTYISEEFKIGNEVVFVLPRICFKTSNNLLIDKIKGLFNKGIDISNDFEVYTIESSFKSSEEVLQIVSKIKEIEDVEWCEPDLFMKINFHDPLYNSQYYLKNTGQNGGVAGYDINVENAWKITRGDNDIVVAVIDCGVDKNHEDLLGRVLDGYTIGDTISKGAPINASTYNKKAHGIACAGIIAASENDKGIKGIAPKIKILPINVNPYYIEDDDKNDGYASASEYANAIKWASLKADILSCSWGSSIPNIIIKNAIDNALKEGRSGKGSVVVASTGNDYSNGEKEVNFPAQMNSVIGVGAIDRKGNIQSYSQRGKYINLVAPSGKTNGNGDVVTLDRMGSLGEANGNYVYNFGGTSAACPQVAGVAALMLSVNPDLTAQQVRELLQETARDLGPTGFDTTYGYGLVDAGAAVKAARSYDISGPTSVCDNATYTISGMSSGFTVSWRVSNNGLTITNGQGTTSVTVSKNASKNCTLYADIKHNGNIVTTLEKTNISVGTPMLGMTITPTNSTGTSGYWIEGASGNSFVIEENNTVDTYGHLEVKVYRLANNGTKTLVSTNNNFQYGSAVGGSYSNGFYELQVRGVKSCGYSQWLLTQVQVKKSNSGEIMFGMDMDLSYDSSSETLNVAIKDDSNNEAQSLAQANISSLADNNMYDVQLWNDNTMLSHFSTSDSQFTIPMSGLKHGAYVVRVAKGENVVSKKIIK